MTASRKDYLAAAYTERVRACNAAYEECKRIRDAAKADALRVRTAANAEYELIYKAACRERSRAIIAANAVYALANASQSTEEKENL